MNKREGNKLICEFVPLPICEKGVLGDNNVYYDITPLRGHNSIVAEEDLRFHCDWNWLMAVVERIEAIDDEHHGHFGVYISSNQCTIEGTRLHMAIAPNSKYGAVYHHSSIADGKREATWYAVVVFIKWYNRYKQEKENESAKSI